VKPPPSLQSMIESVPAVSVAKAIAHLRDRHGVRIEALPSGRWRKVGPTAIDLQDDDVVRLYRLKTASLRRCAP
jgi:hypothetical protein